MTSALLHQMLRTNDTETEPGHDCDDNSIHSVGCLIDGAVDGIYWKNVILQCHAYMLH
jgi:hypothetical protein